MSPDAALAAIQASPVLDLIVTLLAYQTGLALYRRAGRHPLLLPVFVGLLLVIAFNLATGRSYADYRVGAEALYLLLGPVTVALAVPLYQRIDHIRAMAGPLLITCLFTGLVVAAAAYFGMGLLGAEEPLQRSLVPKAATTPIAILIADGIGGLPAIAAISVMLTGIFGAMTGPPLLRRLGIRDEAILGFALGLSAHAVGTARAFEISPRCGAFSALGMSLMGLLLAVALPLLLG